MPALAIRQDLTPTELRRLARFEPDRRASMRLLAIANALEGMSRADAARLAGMERQALRDAVLRYHRDYTAVLDATCAAWNRLLQEKGRLASLTGYAYLMQSLAFLIAHDTHPPVK